YAAPSLFLGEDDERAVELARAGGATVVELDARVFRSVSGLPRPDGLIAVAERPCRAVASLPLRGLRPVPAGVERPGNLGTMVRTACAAGASAVVVADGRTDPFHPDAVHASVGTVFELPVATATTAEALAWWPGRIVVASPDGGRPHWDADYR